MLIIFGGLPGIGKTTLAKALAPRLSAVYLRIDTVEQTIIRANRTSRYNMDEIGYLIGYATALDNLQLGLTVIADSVNPLMITRDAWVNVARKAAVPCFEIEVICSDIEEHRLRIARRQADIANHQLSTWQSVIHCQYAPWEREHCLIDTATCSIEQAVNTIISQLPS